MTSSKPGEISYFGIQAFTGTTKHMGGMASTNELINHCRIREGMYVLDVGCGVGATASYLTQVLGCTVVGVDITPGMIERSIQRSHREGFEDRAEFKVGDVRDLPLEGDQFDAVICESVLTFVEDKQTAIKELVRVVKPGGRVGFNEETWLKTPVPQEMIEYSHKTWEIEHEVPMREDWLRMMEASGLVDIEAHIHQFDTAREATQMRRYRGRDMWLMMVRTLSLFFTSGEFRSYMRKRRALPKGLFEYLGYGLFIGQKPG